MLEKTENKNRSCEIVSINDLIPKDHLLRKIEKSMNFSELYAFVEDKYNNNIITSFIKKVYPKVKFSTLTRFFVIFSTFV